MNAGGYGASALRGERSTKKPDIPLRLEIAMSRIILISSFAALLAACGTQSADAIQNADRDTWSQAALACADVGIAPGGDAFRQCVADLHDSVWAARRLEGS
jgi:hypothetical protein